MFKAQIHRKLTREEENMEDLLTSSVFGVTSLKTLGTAGSIIVDSSFEESRIRELASAFPSLLAYCERDTEAMVSLFEELR